MKVSMLRVICFNKWKDLQEAKTVAKLGQGLEEAQEEMVKKMEEQMSRLGGVLMGRSSKQLEEMCFVQWSKLVIEQKLHTHLTSKLETEALKQQMDAKANEVSEATANKYWKAHCNKLVAECLVTWNEMVEQKRRQKHHEQEMQKLMSTQADSDEKAEKVAEKYYKLHMDELQRNCLLVWHQDASRKRREKMQHDAVEELRSEQLRKADEAALIAADGYYRQYINQLQHLVFTLWHRRAHFDSAQRRHQSLHEELEAQREEAREKILKQHAKFASAFSQGNFYSWIRTFLNAWRRLTSREVVDGARLEREAARFQQEKLAGSVLAVAFKLADSHSESALQLVFLRWLVLSRQQQALGRFDRAQARHAETMEAHYKEVADARQRRNLMLGNMQKFMPASDRSRLFIWFHEWNILTLKESRSKLHGLAEEELQRRLAEIDNSTHTSVHSLAAKLWQKTLVGDQVAIFMAWREATREEKRAARFEVERQAILDEIAARNAAVELAKKGTAAAFLMGRGKGQMRAVVLQWHKYAKVMIEKKFHDMTKDEHRKELERRAEENRGGRSLAISWCRRKVVDANLIVCFLHWLMVATDANNTLIAMRMKKEREHALRNAKLHTTERVVGAVDKTVWYLLLLKHLFMWNAAAVYWTAERRFAKKLELAEQRFDDDLEQYARASAEHAQRIAKDSLLYRIELEQLFTLQRHLSSWQHGGKALRMNLELQRSQLAIEDDLAKMAIATTAWKDALMADIGLRYSFMYNVSTLELAFLQWNFRTRFSKAAAKAAERIEVLENALKDEDEADGVAGASAAGPGQPMLLSAAQLKAQAAQSMDAVVKFLEAEQAVLLLYTTFAEFRKLVLSRRSQQVLEKSAEECEEQLAKLQMSLVDRLSRMCEQRWQDRRNADAHCVVMVWRQFSLLTRLERSLTQSKQQFEDYKQAKEQQLEREFQGEDENLLDGAGRLTAGSLVARFARYMARAKDNMLSMRCLNQWHLVKCSAELRDGRDVLEAKLAVTVDEHKEERKRLVETSFQRRLRLATMTKTAVDRCLEQLVFQRCFVAWSYRILRSLLIKERKKRIAAAETRALALNKPREPNWEALARNCVQPPGLADALRIKVVLGRWTTYVWECRMSAQIATHMDELWQTKRAQLKWVEARVDTFCDASQKVIDWWILNYFYWQWKRSKDIERVEEANANEIRAAKFQLQRNQAWQAETVLDALQIAVRLMFTRHREDANEQFLTAFMRYWKAYNIVAKYEFVRARARDLERRLATEPEVLREGFKAASVQLSTALVFLTGQCLPKRADFYLAAHCFFFWLGTALKGHIEFLKKAQRRRVNAEDLDLKRKSSLLMLVDQAQKSIGRREGGASSEASVYAELVEDAIVGAMRLNVDSIDDFRVGDKIQVGDEQHVVAAFGSIVLEEPLRESHPVGTRVVLMEKAFVAQVSMWRTSRLQGSMLKNRSDVVAVCYIMGKFENKVHTEPVQVDKQQTSLSKLFNFKGDLPGVRKLDTLVFELRDSKDLHDSRADAIATGTLMPDDLEKHEFEGSLPLYGAGSELCGSLMASVRLARGPAPVPLPGPEEKAETMPDFKAELRQSLAKRLSDSQHGPTLALPGVQEEAHDAATDATQPKPAGSSSGRPSGEEAQSKGGMDVQRPDNAGLLEEDAFAVGGPGGAKDLPLNLGTPLEAATDASSSQRAPRRGSVPLPERAMASPQTEPASESAPPRTSLSKLFKAEELKRPQLEKRSFAGSAAGAESREGSKTVPQDSTAEDQEPKPEPPEKDAIADEQAALPPTEARAGPEASQGNSPDRQEEPKHEPPEKGAIAGEQAALPPTNARAAPAASQGNSPDRKEETQPSSDGTAVSPVELQETWRRRESSAAAEDAELQRQLESLQRTMDDVHRQLLQEEGGT
eukprot:TRINITY_DN12671_c0_g5_i1.p1 TRINITY_DN12671_c0_g5~~TRINITY_DN12671_c0_g5_i1.p1  ORF type:complete len:2201 (-),score=698.40 TRINITY_DN12671_c0_g5_i1:744-6452(-)